MLWANLKKLFLKSYLKMNNYPLRTIKGSVNIPVKQIKFSKNAISMMGS